MTGHEPLRQGGEKVSPLREWLRDNGMDEDEAEARCARIGLVDVYRVLLSGSQTLPTLALKIGRVLGMNSEAVKPLGHPLNRRIWLADRKKDPNGLPNPRPLDVDDHWYRQCDETWTAHNTLDMDALHRRVEETGMAWLAFRDRYIKEIRGAANRRNKEKTVRRHAQILAEALGCEVDELLGDQGDVPQAAAPQELPHPRAVAGTVSVNMLEAVRHEKGLTRDQAGERWQALGYKDSERTGAQTWNTLLYRLADAPMIREATAERLEKTLGVKRERFLK